MKEMILEPLEFSIGAFSALLVGAGVYRALARRRLAELWAWNAGNATFLLLIAVAALGFGGPSPLAGAALSLTFLACLGFYAGAGLRIFEEGQPLHSWLLAVLLPLGLGLLLAFLRGRAEIFSFVCALLGAALSVTTSLLILRRRGPSGMANGPGLLSLAFGFSALLQFLHALALLLPGWAPAAALASDGFLFESALVLFLSANFVLLLILTTRLEREVSDRAAESARGQMELQLLYDAFAGTAGTMDPVELLHKVLDLIQERLEADAVVIYLEDREGEGLSMAAQRGLDRACLALLARPDPGTSVAGLAFAAGRPTARRVDDYESGPLREALSGLGLGVVGGFPISVAGKPIGALTAGYREPGQLDPLRQTLLETLSLQLGSVIKAAILHAKLDRANARLSELASTDVLTELANRRAALQALDREIARARRTGGLVAVIMGDLDHFKGFNDRHGHDCGDYVLMSSASIIADTVRATDIPSRWGGEEFLVVLGESEPAGAFRLAERLRERIESAKWEYGDRRLRVTMTLGVGVAPPSLGAEAVIALADEALYQGKRAGRNRVTMLLDDGRRGEAETPPIALDAEPLEDEELEVLPLADESLKA